MGERFLDNFVKRICDTNTSCKNCKIRHATCKYPHLYYNHYPHQITLLLLDNLLDYETDIDTVLSIMHNREQLSARNMNQFIEFIECDGDRILPAVIQHFDCIDDHSFCYIMQKDEAETWFHPEKDIGTITFKEWFKQKYINHFKEYEVSNEM